MMFLFIIPFLVCFYHFVTLLFANLVLLSFLLFCHCPFDLFAYADSGFAVFVARASFVFEYGPLINAHTLVGCMFVCDTTIDSFVNCFAILLLFCAVASSYSVSAIL